MNATHEQPSSRIGQVETWVAWLLRIGVGVSAACIALGLVWAWLAHGSGYDPGAYPTSLSDVWLGLAAGKPYALVMLGLLLLIATPVLRVACSVVAFWFERDRLYTVITLVVLAVLLTSFILGKAE